ncbi:hypothetical protein RJ639_011647 [Escallonia herrerae]|uniref:Uncharacterized protein n=1 Tax=Escallonia herrerae TaxID=1293975 RepID=A0AA88VMV4_9ASTE|nr:hypothetical protein RJ639_011647 [Escallonia herrerae]
MMLNVMMRMIAGKRYYGERAGEAEEARSIRDTVTETFKLNGYRDGDVKRDAVAQGLVDERRGGGGGGGGGGGEK